MAKKLSKTRYMMGLQCPKRLWLYDHRRDLAAPPGPAQRRLDEGLAAGELARQALPGGELVACGPALQHLALRRTAELVKEGPRFIYEAAFAAGDVLVRCDILERNYDGSWDLIEVKSSTGVLDEQLPDAALQLYVLEACGLKVNKVWLMHLDGAYVRRGALDPAALFKRADITGAAAALRSETEANIWKFQRLTASAEVPGEAIGRHCQSPYECEFKAHCWKGLPEYSVYDIPRLTWEKKDLLRLMGVLKFTDVPDDFGLNEAQRLYLEVERTGEPVIDRPAINAFLKTLSYPLYHVDFETLQPALPLYEGSRPYQQIPFQMSLHVQDAPGAEPRHFEYLGDHREDPRPGLIAALRGNIGGKGSLLAYNSGFEAARLRELGEDFPSARTAMNALAGRLADLMKPFQQQAFVHPGFKGRYSIKVVLPALVPGMTYKNLAIGNGGDAQSAYDAMVRGKMNPGEVEKTRRDLLEYCGQDTLAMVKVLERLYAEASDWRAGGG